jgi:hypothetical protein
MAEHVVHVQCIVCVVCAGCMLAHKYIEFDCQSIRYEKHTPTFESELETVVT